MKVYKPYYYDNFSCIAEACPFTCCKDWRIAVDEETGAKWEKMPMPGEDGRKGQMLAEQIREDAEGKALAFSQGSCPFLSEQGLCHVVMSYGDAHIPKTCQQYPREPHVSGSRVEHNLELGCPAVIDLLIRGGRFEILCREGEDTELCSHYVTAWDQDVPEVYYRIREHFMMIAEDKSLTVDAVLGTIFFIALDLLELEEEKEKGCLSMEDFEVYCADPDNSELSGEIEDIIRKADPVERFAERNELLLDLMENYRKRGIYTEYIEPLAELAEAYAREDYAACDDRFFERISQVEKACDDWMRLVILEELYGEIVLSGTECMEDLVIKLQWLGLQYAAIRQCIGLCMEEKDLENIKEETLYGIFKKYLMVIIRMTGYTEENIEEYLENSFEDLIWPWNYYGLIV